MQLTKHFKLAEFQCKDGTPVPDVYLENVQKLAEQLEIIRAEVEEPIYITSGFRTKRHNTHVGGVINSQHLTASASDIHCKGISPFYLFQRIKYLMRNNRIQKGAVILYKNFVHYDIRGYEYFNDAR